MKLKKTWQLPISIQIERMRELQTYVGQLACYATAVGGECERDRCGWREDCFDDAREQTGCRS